jgi:hypothetical protein
MQRIPRTPVGRLALCLVIAIAACPLSSQSVEAWFSRAKEASAYASVQADFLALSAAARAGMLTDRPLSDRIVEGARKGVAPQRLLAILKDETGKLLTVAALLRERGLMPANAETADRLFSQAAIMLRTGLEPEDFKAALDGAISSLGANQAASARAIAVLAAVAGIPVDEEARQDIIVALASGPLPDSRLDSARSTWAGLAARSVPPADMVKALVESLGPAKPGSGKDVQPKPPEGPPPAKGQGTDKPGGAENQAPRLGPESSGGPVPGSAPPPKPGR